MQTYKNKLRFKEIFPIENKIEIDCSMFDSIVKLCYFYLTDYCKRYC